MNAKEKAKDLYDKMKGFRVKNSHRKKCALVCVDEILKSDLRKSPYDTRNPYEYWNEVKNEIEKL